MLIVSVIQAVVSAGIGITAGLTCYFNRSVWPGLALVLAVIVEMCCGVAISLFMLSIILSSDIRDRLSRIKKDYYLQHIYSDDLDEQTVNKAIVAANLNNIVNGSFPTI
jgi:hypothetical protein